MISVQFYSDDFPQINACVFVNQKNVLDKTLRHLSKHCRTGRFTLYGHNLTFDLLSIFYPVKERLIAHNGLFDVTHREWDIDGIYGNTTFCRMRHRTRDLTVFIVDGYSWFQSTLARASRLVCPHLPKLRRIEGLGTKMFTAADDDFVQYAMRDAEVSYHIGKAVDSMHDEFDLNQCVSVADMSAKIFRQHYIHDSAPIWNVNREIMQGAFASYHGGKNNVVPGAAPAWHSHIDAWDLSSAYPHAMTQCPPFSNPRLFVQNQIFSKRSQHFPDHAVYQISGTVASCDWPILYTADFKPIRGGKFEDIWLTGFELNEARRADEITLSKVKGHLYKTENDPVDETGLQRFVKDFYSLKQSATDEVRRSLYKVLLNSLYGKFIQMNEMESEGDAGIQWKPGPLFHPFLASLITGHTRAVMHRLEHQVQAIHTATDGVYCGSRNSPADGRFDWAPQSGLGSIESEGKDMELALLRNKLYVLYSKKQKGSQFHSFIRPNRFVMKYAKHGFQGGPKDLEEACVIGTRTYTVEKPNTLKTALKQGKVPNKFERKEITLNVDPITVHYDWS